MAGSSPHEKYVAGLPDDWGREPLRALGEIVGGSTPSRAVPRYWNGDIPWVTPGELTSLGGKYLHETRERSRAPVTRAVGLGSSLLAHCSSPQEQHLARSLSLKMR